MRGNSANTNDGADAFLGTRGVNIAGDTTGGGTTSLTGSTNDMSSAYAASNATNSNQVTVIACYQWTPPLSGFLLIPRKILMQASISEALEYQQ